MRNVTVGNMSRKRAPEIGVKGALRNVKQPKITPYCIRRDPQKELCMNSPSKYTEDTDYHAIMMFDPWKEQAENLGHELVMTKIDLVYETQMHDYWKKMYQNEVESNNRQC